MGVGGADSGPGLPGLRWSTEHGDLRVAHFVGLHAIQAIPLVAFFTRRRMSDRLRAAVVVGAGISYGTFFTLLLAQALVGQAATAPSGWVLRALALWAAANGTLIAFTWHASRRAVAHDACPIKETE